MSMAVLYWRGATAHVLRMRLRYEMCWIILEVLLECSKGRIVVFLGSLSVYAKRGGGV